jgi:hypothetical protein
MCIPHAFRMVNRPRVVFPTTDAAGNGERSELGISGDLGGAQVQRRYSQPETNGRVIQKTDCMDFSWVVRLLSNLKVFPLLILSPMWTCLWCACTSLRPSSDPHSYGVVPLKAIRPAHTLLPDHKTPAINAPSRDNIHADLFSMFFWYVRLEINKFVIFRVRPDRQCPNPIKVLRLS